MFDNQTPPQNLNANPNPQPPATGLASSTMPAREPEDIFAGTDKPAAKPPQFQPKNQSAGQAAGQQSQTMPQAPAQIPGTQTAKSGGGNRKYLIIGVVAIVALIIIFIAMVVLAYFKAQEPAIQATLPAPASTDTNAGADADAAMTDQNETMTAPEGTGEVIQPDTADSLPSEPSTAAPSLTGSVGGQNSDFIVDEITDSDGDGLTDAEEKRLGTAPDSADTDGDVLSDREEVRVYRTDPTNSDTDADGYTDGEEVNNGYNPKGDGKLYELPAN
jgi:cell division septation protein DedD